MEILRLVRAIVWPRSESTSPRFLNTMKSAPKKRSAQAIRLLLVSSAFILEGCSPPTPIVPSPSLAPDQEKLQEDLATGEQQPPSQAVAPSSQTGSGYRNHSTSGWSYITPFLLGYGSGSYGRSWNSNSSWSSNSSNRLSNGTSSSGHSSGPASHFGGQNSLPAPSHTPSTHSTSSTSHVSSPSVSRGGFGGHASSASS
jgi:hypothetical protein